METKAVKEANKKAEKEVFAAVSSNDMTKIKELIARKVNVNIQDNFGDTPLIKAVSRNFEEMVHVLIAAGCRLDTQNVQGNTALITAAKAGTEKLIHPLVKAGADVDICNVHGDTVFDFVKNADTIRTLLEARRSEKGRNAQKLKDFVWEAPARKIAQQFETKNFLTSLRLYGLFAEAFQRLNADEFKKVNSLLKGRVTTHEKNQMNKIYQAKMKVQNVHA